MRNRSGGSAALRRGVALGVVGVVVGTARGGPPMLTDDPGTRLKGEWEINVPYTLTMARGRNQMNAPLVDTNYSPTDHVQLRYDVAWVVEGQGDGTGEHSGLGNSLVAVKWRFADQETAGVSLGVVPTYEFNNPTASARQGIVAGGAVLTLPVVAGWGEGRFETFSELGYQFVQHGGDQWFWGVAAGYKVTERVEVLAEVFTTVDAGFREPEPILNLGASWAVTDWVNVQVSAGRGVLDRADSPVAVVYAGLQFHF